MKNYRLKLLSIPVVLFVFCTIAANGQNGIVVASNDTKPAAVKEEPIDTEGEKTAKKKKSKPDRSTGVALAR